MNRSEFQTLAEVRLKEAKALLDVQLWDGAYYLAGYAVECGLKACILARVERTGVLFEDRKFSETCWTHKLDVLLKAADLESPHKAEVTANSKFDAYWRVALDWKEDARYKFTTRLDAESLYESVSDPTNGVLRWIRGHW